MVDTTTKITAIGRMPSKTPAKILVVEDNPCVGKMLRFSLRGAGFAITAVSTGGEALQVLLQEPIDVVILELGLPDGLGRAVLDWLHQQKRAEGHSNPSPAWVVITAQDRHEAVRRYGPLGRPLPGKALRSLGACQTDRGSTNKAG